MCQRTCATCSICFCCKQLQQESCLTTLGSPFAALILNLGAFTHTVYVHLFIDTYAYVCRCAFVWYFY